MELDLDLKAARAAREIEERIKAELLRLPLDLRKATLERVAVDVLIDGVGTPQRPVPAPPASPVARPSAPKPPTDAEPEDEKHWERILAWCREHPAAEHRNVVVAEALYPERFNAGGNARNVIVSTVYSSTLRRSVGRCATPDFVILGRGRFRLATDEEREKARAARARAKGGAAP